MSDIILSKNSNIEKLMRFVVDKLEKNDIVGIRATVEQAERLRDFVDTLCQVFDCKVADKKTGHYKSRGQHLKVVRYSISSNNLEFHDEVEKIV